VSHLHHLSPRLPLLRHPPTSTPFPYTTLFRSSIVIVLVSLNIKEGESRLCVANNDFIRFSRRNFLNDELPDGGVQRLREAGRVRSEEHTSELQSRENLVCRLLLEKKKKTKRLS